MRLCGRRLRPPLFKDVELIGQECANGAEKAMVPSIGDASECHDVVLLCPATSTEPNTWSLTTLAESISRDSRLGARLQRRR